MLTVILILVVSLLSIYPLWRLFSFVLDKILDKLYEYIESRGLGYASALADIYFYGYLKIVLPDKGTLDMKGIDERIQEYKDDQQLNDEVFPVHKMFVVVTSSGYSYPDISQEAKAYGRIRKRTNLLDHPVCSRAGIQRRSYQTQVYQVYSKNKEKHISVVMECAPSLMQLYKAALLNPVLKKYKSKIIKRSVFFLEKLLEENADCKDKCEIIYCDESSPDFNLADAIFERVNKCLSANSAISRN